ncbi:MAG: hypothetical protein EBT83_02760, partial [Betaproteobacteria bacterium]|nr:hypothetical protein [Betaproteobacteria bacterium]
KRAELQRTVDEVLFEARPGRRLPLAISVGAAIYPQDLPSKDPADFVLKKAEGLAEQVVNMLLSQTGGAA